MAHSLYTELPSHCEQRFLSGMAFSVYEVVPVACQSRIWFCLSPTSATTRQTSYANDFVNDAKSQAGEKHLLAGYSHFGFKTVIWGNSEIAHFLVVYHLHVLVGSRFGQMAISKI